MSSILEGWWFKTYETQSFKTYKQTCNLKKFIILNIIKKWKKIIFSIFWGKNLILTLHIVSRILQLKRWTLVKKWNVSVNVTFCCWKPNYFFWIVLTKQCRLCVIVLRFLCCYSLYNLEKINSSYCGKRCSLRKINFQVNLSFNYQQTCHFAVWHQNMFFCYAFVAKKFLLL